MTTKEMNERRVIEIMAMLYEQVEFIADDGARDAACDHLDDIADCFGLKDEFFERIGLN